MKRIIAGLLSVLLVLTGSTAIAENDFQMFGGVTFGMKKSTVEELMVGYQKGDPTSTTLGVPYRDNNIECTCVRAVSIAGIDNSLVFFAYDKDERVYQCVYDFGNQTPDASKYYNKEESSSVFNAVENMLDKKY